MAVPGLRQGADAGVCRVRRGDERVRGTGWEAPGMTKPQAALWRALYAAEAARLQVRQIHTRYPVAGRS